MISLNIGVANLRGGFLGGVSVPDFTPSADPNTIAWFELADPADQTLVGTAVSAVANRIAGSAVTATEVDSSFRFQTGGTLNGVPALAGNDDSFDIAGLPQTGKLNIFIGAKVASSGTVSYGGSTNNSFLGLLSEASSTSGVLRINGVTDAAGVSMLFDFEDTQSVTTRSAASAAGQIASMVSFVGCDAIADADVRIGRAQSNYHFIGVMTRIVFVAGDMTPEEILAMQTYFATQDNWLPTDDLLDSFMGPL